MWKLVSNVALIVLLLATGCAPRSGTGDVGIYGVYQVAGTAGDVTPPPATLEVSRSSRYRFCRATRCVGGRWSLQLLKAGDGRITFHGADVEAYVLALSTAAEGRSEIDERRGIQGAVDLDWSSGPSGTQIPLYIGDIAFVKR